MRFCHFYNEDSSMAECLLQDVICLLVFVVLHIQVTT